MTRGVPRPRPRHRRSVSMGSHPPARSRPTDSPYAAFPGFEVPGTMTRGPPHSRQDVRPPPVRPLPPPSSRAPLSRPMMPPPPPPPSQPPRHHRRQHSGSVVPDTFARSASMQMSPMQTVTAPVTRARTPELPGEEDEKEELWVPADAPTPKLGLVKQFVAEMPEYKSDYEDWPERIRELLELKDMEEAAFEDLELADIERRAQERAEQLRTEILMDEQRLAEIDRKLAELMGNTYGPADAAQALRPI